MLRSKQPPRHGTDFEQQIADFTRRDRFRAFELEPPRSKTGFRSDPVWRDLRAAGTELWLDSGDLDRNAAVWSGDFDGLTTNNTLLNREVQKGIYDGFIAEAAAAIGEADPSIDDDALLLELAFVLNALHGRRLARRFDADVSVELHTSLCRDADLSYEYGRRYHAICPEHFVVKIAMTPEGLIAARRLEQAGIRVNFTLGFSPRQNELIARFAQPHFVNVFVGRVDALFAAMQPGADERPSAGIVAAIASQRMLRERSHGAGRVRQIAASLRDADQLAQLAGIDVITMPVAVAEAFVETGPQRRPIRDATREAGTLDRFDAIDRDDPRHVFGVVERASLDAATELLLQHPDTLSGERIRAILADLGLGDLFPRLSSTDAQTLAAGGKLPDTANWERRVADGHASWDGLLTEAGLAAFAADQAELDERVRRQL